MKRIEKLAKEYVLSEIDPSDFIERSPDNVCIESFEAGFRKAREMAYQACQDIAQPDHLPEDCPTSNQYAEAVWHIGEEEV